MTPLDKWRLEVGDRLRQCIKNDYGKRKEHIFADHIQISQGSLSDILNGISSPSAVTLRKITVLTGIDIRWLLTGVEKN